MARLATILSFGDHTDDADDVPEQHAAEHYREEDDHDDAASDASDDSFEFAFARPLVTAPEADALADDLFAHGRIIPAYPVFHRLQDPTSSASAATAPPSPDTYCAWTPRSAPGSPVRDLPAFPKSASTGQASAVPRFRLRDLVGSGAGRRSHSDGREKFLFLQPTPKPKTTAPSAAASSTAGEKQAAKKHSSQKPKQQGKKKGAAVTEMDMATAHRLFYSKPGATTAASERTTTTRSYLPYRPAIVGFFAAAHGLRPKHHPY